MSFADAIVMLKEDLNFPDERANYFVKKFDKNGDGKLSVSEFHNFKKTIEDTFVMLVVRESMYLYVNRIACV